MGKSYTDKRILSSLKYLLIITGILLFARIAFVLMYVPLCEIVQNKPSIPLLIFNSMRFDLQVGAYVMLIPTALLIAGIWIKGERYKKLVSIFHIIYFTLISTLLIILSVIDLGFYHNFNSHINITLFDFFNEGPAGLITAIWEEYHVMVYGFAILASILSVFLLSRRIEKHCLNDTKEHNRKTTYVGLIVFVLFIAVCLRGSVWRFPLQVEDTYVSSSKTLNDVVPNSVYMLKKALKEKSKAFDIPDVEALVREYQFNDLQEALDVYTGKRMTLGSDTLKSLHDALFESVADTLTHKQPNILIIYGESWSNFLMNLDSKDNDMLYGMRRHISEDLFFRNFQSVCNGTIASLENITVSTPLPRLFASRYHMIELPTSIAIPFNESGYMTEFISGMDVAWENCAEALCYQKFKKIIGKYALLKEHPEYKYNSIGVFDHHLFNSVLEHLNAENDLPKMILTVTTTNHPPFELPEKGIIDMPDDEFYRNPVFAEKNKKVLAKYIAGYKYYNKMLGEFLDNFKKSPAARNTIIIATGDHNVRSILDYTKIDLRWKYSVPMYVYIPPYLMREEYKNSTERWGCHDDIVATIAPFAFKHTSYMPMGKNLLCDTIAEYQFYSYNQEQTIAMPRYKQTAEKILRARNLLRLVYFSQLFAKEKK